MNKSVKTDLGNQEIFSRNLKRYLENSGKRLVMRSMGFSPYTEGYMTQAGGGKTPPPLFC